jgi:hypothetical protein
MYGRVAFQDWIVVIVMAIFDSVCLWGAARAFRRTLGLTVVI